MIEAIGANGPRRRRAVGQHAGRDEQEATEQVGVVLAEQPDARLGVGAGHAEAVEQLAQIALGRRDPFGVVGRVAGR